MGNSNRKFKSTDKLSEFQKSKLLHEFKTFFDLDGDGLVTWNDFEVAKDFTCKINCWKPTSEKALSCDLLFANIWESLQMYADKNSDGKISSDEWLNMWQALLRQVLVGASGETPKTDEDLPMWLYKYLLHRFHVLDRSGDGVIDQEEYEYVMSNFNVTGRDARKAFLIFSENETKKIDFDTFCQLSTDYFFSSDPASLGNFITGKLDFSSDDKK